jgi:tetratricopeptide (TPR) repeat protein
VDLFQSSGKGEWYFYNNSAKGKGFNEFKSRWGTRSNADNWRRKSASSQAMNNNPTPPNGLNLPNGVKKDLNNTPGSQAEITYEDLEKNVPLTPEKLKASKDLLAQSFYELGKLYQDELLDYSEAINTYEECLQRFPDILYDGDLYYNLYYCYNKLGNSSKAAYYKTLLMNKFPNSKPGKTVSNPVTNAGSQNPEATKQYGDIYNLFIEGKFDEAIAQKKQADSKYGQNYWTPQLLYIEAMYLVKQRNDSAAKTGLQNIISIYPNSGLASKAKNLLEALSRRKETEDYLNALQITRMKEEETIIVDDKPVVNNNPVVNNPVVTTPVTTPAVVKPATADTTKKTPAPVLSNGVFALAPASPHYVVMILDKVDPVYVGESKNAFDRYNGENFYNTPISINKDAIDNDIKLLLFKPFADAAAAIQYADKIKRAAASEVSWLPANKYSFIIITEVNLQLLKTNKDIAGYKKLLNTQYPGKF